MAINYIEKYKLKDKEQEIIDWGMKKYPDYVRNINVMARLYLIEQGILTAEDLKEETKYTKERKEISKEDYAEIEVDSIATTDKERIKLSGLIIVEFGISELILCRRCNKRVRRGSVCNNCGESGNRIVKVERYKILTKGEKNIEFEVSRYYRDNNIKLEMGKEYIFYLRKRTLKNGISLVVDIAEKIENKSDEIMDNFSDYIVIASNIPDRIDKELALKWFENRKLNFEDYKSRFTEIIENEKVYLKINK